MMVDFIVDRDKCTRCGECVKDCPVQIISLESGWPELVTERADQCLECQHCLAVCPAGAVSVLGRNPAASQPLAGALPAMPALETLVKGRRSVRRFQPEAVPSETIRRLLTVTAHAPTGKNHRGVLFTVVEDGATMERLRQGVMEAIREAVGQERLPPRLDFFAGILKAWDKGRDIIFRRAPHLLVASAPRNAPTPMADCLIALSTFDLLATNAGLGTLWVGFAHAALGHCAPHLVRQLGIPDDHELACPMVFGVPAVRYHRTVQRDADLQLNRVVW
jgi:nitroreductase/NAD-dependent dihydropyrimidine dehydrogenase PreA subunit